MLSKIDGEVHGETDGNIDGEVVGAMDCKIDGASNEKCSVKQTARSTPK